ncbi:MAG TPA: glutamate 5-kinase [Caulobacteraceae bacterium]
MNLLANADLVVVKVGSALVAKGETGGADNAWLAAFAGDAARLRARGQRLLIVSSGAVALGRKRLNLGRRTLTLAEKQACAATGQSRLMRAWEEAFEPLGLATAQVLLTPDDTEIRRRFLNARATLVTLLQLGLIPIVNENDTVATEELRYGDNDRLAARVSQMAGADLLVLLSDVDGLYTSDPRRDRSARHVPLVGEITPAIDAMAGGANLGRGGMATKLAAARIAGAAGCGVVITLGSRIAPLQAVEQGQAFTFFKPETTPAAAYKSWIAGTLAPQGVVVIDNGAAAALRMGKSLLAAGVRAVEGRFGKGDAVIVRDGAGLEVGRGLCRYDHTEAMKIIGRRSEGVQDTLGYNGGPVIHANDLALTRRREGAL